METTKNAHDAFAPVTEDLHPHGTDPDMPAPESVEALSEELAELSGKLHDAALVLRRVCRHFEGPHDEEEHGTILTAAGLAERSHQRLQEASDALHAGHTDGVGWRMDEVALPVSNVHALITDWMGGYPSDTAKRLSGTIYAAAWSLDYVEERLRYLVGRELAFLE